jgi:preprotein translocase subunit SecA
VLVGTRSVEASESAAAALAERSAEVVALNTRQDVEEEAIVGRAGASDRITVATNMADRGTAITSGLQNTHNPHEHW